MECKIWVQFTNNYCCPGEIVPILHMCQWMHISGCMFNDGNVSGCSGQVSSLSSPLQSNCTCYRFLDFS